MFRIGILALCLALNVLAIKVIKELKDRTKELQDQAEELRVCAADKATLLTERAARTKALAAQEKQEATRTATADDNWLVRTMCAVHRYAWVTRVEGAAGIPPGSLKPALENKTTKSFSFVQQKRFIAALKKYPFPECADLDDQGSSE
jgi:hypothetical protein